MALKFRRGTTAQKSGSLAFGEPYVNTTLGTLQIGGQNGDITLSINSASAGISGSSLDITGNAKIDGNLTLGGQLTIGDATSDTVNVVASLSSSLIPSETNAFDLGSATKIWRDLYISTGSIKFVEGTSVVKTFNVESLTSLEAATGSSNVSIANLNSFTSSIDTTIKNKLNSDGVISGSIQVLGGTGIVSSSAQIDALFNLDGVISGSSQVTLSSTTGGGTSADVQFGSLGIGMAASGVSGEIKASADIIAFASSDNRLKENIKPIEKALDKVSKISGNTYDWKTGFENIHSHTGEDVGVIAQEIEAVLPQLVTTREHGYKAVQYEKLTALLIEAIKEQQIQIHNLTLEVEKLKEQKGL